MAGGIQPETCAASVESKNSEKRHCDLIKEVIEEAGPDWSIKKSLTVEEILGHLGEYSKLLNGESQELQSDGGFIFWRGELCGVCENKYQKNRPNACERVTKYLTFLKAYQMFVSFEGPGFVKKDGGGATGPLIDLLGHAGATVLENISDNNQYKEMAHEWLNRIKPTEKQHETTFYVGRRKEQNAQALQTPSTQHI